MVVGVLNDTIGSKNFGCQLVSHSLRKYLDKVEGITEIKYFPFNKKIGSKEGIDLIIVNGEGSFGHKSRTPDGFAKLDKTIREYADAEVPVYLVNFSFQVRDTYSKYKGLFAKCKKVAVRDPFSYACLQKLGVENLLLFPDFGSSYFDYQNQKKVYDIVFGLGAISKFIPKNSDEYKRYGDLINFYAQNYKVGFLDFPSNPASDLEKMKKFLSTDVAIIKGTFEDCFNGISQSKLLVTGRHHATIMALVAKVPFVSFDSNMWKTEGNQIFYGPYSNFQFTDKDNVRKDNINFTLNRLEEATVKAKTSYDKLKPYFTGHLDCVFNDVNDVIQNNVLSLDINDAKSRFKYIDFSKYGV